MKKRTFISFSFLTLSIVSSSIPLALAADDQTPPAPAEIKPNVPGGAQALGETTSEAQNNRMKTLEGSKSPLSGQFNITYQGSSVSHPFSELAPNPSNQTPPPRVTLSGTMAVRYRLDPQTTLGLGTGITAETPFQGPKNATLSDPYLDLAHSYLFHEVHNRADIQLQLWTNNEYHNDFGYRGGLILSNDSSYLTRFGLTIGFYAELDYNTFSGDAAFTSPTASASVLQNQTQWDLNTDPYFEYRLSEKFNLRTVIGVIWNNTRDQAGALSLTGKTVYETLGVGIQVLPAWFVYPFVEFFPKNITSNNSIVGFNTIINLF